MSRLNLGLPPDPAWRRGRDALVVFKGPGEYFRPLYGCHELINQELEARVRPRWRIAAAEASRGRPIGVHVRRGDFGTARSASDFVTSGNLRTPIEWFAATLDHVRAVIGSDVPAFVVSDGPRSDLEALLRRPSVAFARTGSAIGDLLALSRSRLLIASGGSTFSAWAAYLGQMPTLTIPGQPLSWYKLRNCNGYYVGEFDPCAPLPPELRPQLTSLSKSLDSSHEL